jgi:hypothetical protein
MLRATWDSCQIGADEDFFIFFLASRDRIVKRLRRAKRADAVTPRSSCVSF